MKPFHLVFAFYQRELSYSIAIAILSAYVKRTVRGIKVSLLDIIQGHDVQETAARAKLLAPDLIAVSAMHPTWKPMTPYLEAIRESQPEIPIIIGGYQAIFSPTETLAYPFVDYICIGDGEEPLVSLIRRLQGKCGGEPIPGIWEKNCSGEIVRSAPFMLPELKGRPIHDYSIFVENGGLLRLSPQGIESRNLKTLPVLTGRGCPNHCSYCSNTALWKLYGNQRGYLRKYEVEEVIEELRDLKDRYAVDYFKFNDELLLSDIPYVYRLLPRFQEEIQLPFSMVSHAVQMTDDLCRFAAQAGCHSMWYGVESGSETYRKQYLNRHMSNETLLKASENARRNGIRQVAYFMMGMPFETREDLQKTFDMVRSIKVDIAILMQYVPLPGTRLYQLCLDHDLIRNDKEGREFSDIDQMNIKEHKGGISIGDYQAIVSEMLEFVNANNVNLAH